jgi:undecaprenyl-diphosphatase
MGSGWFTLLVGAVAGVALAAKRRWMELGGLVVALVIAHVAVPVMKEAIDRPRPPDPLVGAGGDAFPSGHAAYSVIYTWLALIVTVRMRPGMAGATALVLTGIAVTAAIGLSRVYLRVHWLSDVNAGWALGVAAFALCAVVALIGTHLRDNEDSDSRSEDRD